MKVTAVDDLHADGGWRTLSFLKITTDTGLVGWSEFNESRSSPGLGAVVIQLARRLIGADPTNINQIVTGFRASTRMFSGGLVTLAIAAIENACLDLKGKAMGVPVYDLFGGAYRTKLPLYWSQCGTLRTQHAACFNAPPLTSLDDVVELGREVQRRGYKALKTNILLFDQGGGSNYRPGFGSGHDHPALNLDDGVIASVVDLLHAFRQGAGQEVRLMLDLNFNCRPEGARRIARALEAFDLMWLELDTTESESLSELRRSIGTPVASLESVFGQRAMRPFLEANAVDVVIVDPQWNGLSESVHMAHLANSYELNVAAHNYHGQLSTLIGAHYCAAIPNFRIAEFVVDEPDWTRSFLTQPLNIEDGVLTLPTGPGWGSDIDEEAVRARPVRTH